ncbi:HNH endonuclease [Nonomuraea sp. NPDC059023]|uniref:HNH endonuclease n=1 Tax=unclassified Nonomuraea TaxID=2593643 RepID=UPI003695C816
MENAGESRGSAHVLPGSVANRWLSRVNVAGSVPQHDPNLGRCWHWDGGTNKRGYAVISVGGRPELLHRILYPTFHGPIPDGWQVDHLCHHHDWCHEGDTCRHRSCANPSHWYAKTGWDNNRRSGSPTAVNARKTHCWRGHSLTGDNVLSRGDRPGHRECRTCRRLRKFVAEQERMAAAGQLTLL